MAAAPREFPDAPRVGVGAVVLDGCGHRVPLAPVAFVTDTEPPVIRWQVGDQKALSDRLAPDTENDRRRLRGRRGRGRPATDAWQTWAGVWQVPVPWVKEKRGVYAQFPVEIKSDHPQAFLAAPDTTMPASVSFSTWAHTSLTSSGGRSRSTGGWMMAWLMNGTRSSAKAYQRRAFSCQGA